MNSELTREWRKWHNIIVYETGRPPAHAAARKLIAVAEVFRRNPEDGFEAGPGRMPAVVHEFTRDQLAYALGESRAQISGKGCAPGVKCRVAGRAGR
jgi:hypothetical protein